MIEPVVVYFQAAARNRDRDPQRSPTASLPLEVDDVDAGYLHKVEDDLALEAPKQRPWSVA